MNCDLIVKKIVSEKKIKVGERFPKKYLCFNCFSHITGITLDYLFTGHMNLKLKGRLDLNGRNAIVWIPRINNELEFKNEVLDNGNTITMSRFDGGVLESVHANHLDRYTFTRYMDRSNKEIFEFVGLFHFDNNASNKYKQVWRKSPGNEVSLDI